MSSSGKLLSFGPYDAAGWEGDPWGTGIAQPFVSLEGKALVRKRAWMI